MKKLNITKEQFNKSKYFKNKYGNLEYVSESGKLFKTDKGQVLKFKESHQKGEHLYSVIVKKPGGWDGSFQVNAMSSDEALEKARARIGRGSKILRIEDIGEYKAFDADDYAGFNESEKKIVKESVDALATPENVKVDDILYCTSYYDFQIQTFYKVLAKRGTSTLVVQRVEKKYDGTQSDGVVTPSDKVDSRYKPITVRYGKRGFKVGSDKLYIWDGSPLEEYNYSESGKKPRFGRKFKESVGDVSTDPAYVCPYCGHNNCEFVDADDYPEEGYFDGATFNAQFWCKDCEMLYNVTYELKVKEVTPNEDYHKDDLPDDWA